LPIRNQNKHDLILNYINLNLKQKN
jgi:hypothetical protein